MVRTPLVGPPEVAAAAAESGPEQRRWPAAAGQRRPGLLVESQIAGLGADLEGSARAPLGTRIAVEEARIGLADALRLHSSRRRTGGTSRRPIPTVLAELLSPGRLRTHA